MVSRQEKTIAGRRYRAGGNWVYVVTRDIKYAEGLSAELNHFGYRVQIVNEIQKLEKAVAQHMSTALLIDISSQLGVFQDGQIFEDIKRLSGHSLPILFISDRTDQHLRVKAVRAGGEAFLPKPLNVVSLIDQLDALNSAREQYPYRVLIIESQATIATYYQLILQRAGLETRVTTQSTDVLQQLNDFNPDLILLDFYMPEISGIEIVKVIRQIDSYLSIPIVFLTNDADYSLQMEGMMLGGDDFLAKPIRADRLITTIKNRLERSRVLRSFMVRDSLTGLLNHTSFREQLVQEVTRCQRINAPLALAMMDLDHFKKVNDTYGHAIGDSVLKSLSRLLQQRLRRIDIIGRYGGEEFVALLKDVDSKAAFSVMDEIRSHFAHIKHFSPKEGRFSATFSCGISAFPVEQNAILLSDAADRALYAAKTAGRNLTMISGRNKNGE